MKSRTSSQPALSLSERKRKAILDAALQEFDARGFAATSMDQVATRANVSKRTIYNHFSSKEELFDAIRSDLFCKIASIEYQYQHAACLTKQLQAIATQQVELICSDAFVTFARISIPRSLQSVDVAKTTYREFHASHRTILNWIKAAVADGRLQLDDPQFAARQFLGLLNTGLLWPQLIGGQRSPSNAVKKRVIRTTVSMFLSQYQRKSA